MKDKKINIKIKEEPMKKLRIIMENIKELNDGNEIGAWLTGEWTQTKEEITLTLNELIIPKQEVSGTEVDISPESMITMLKEIGAQKANTIKAHWHIHPFGKGETNWSMTDDKKIEDFMNPEKQRHIFCFLLSSEDQIKARIIINTKMEILGETYEYKKDIDNIPITIEENQEITKIKKEIKKEIQEKVTTKKYETFVDFTTEKTTPIDIDLETFKIKVKDQNIRIIMRKEFWEFVEKNYIVKEILDANDIKLKTNVTKILIITKNLEESKSIAEEIQNQLEQITEDYYDTIYEESKIDETRNRQIEELVYKYGGRGYNYDY